MCGIVGAIAQRDVLQILLTGLKRLEYRGYDSAGVAILNEKTGELQRRRTLGKVSVLEQETVDNPVSGHLGIAHTRWATHGIPAERNAHPHMSSGDVAVVHNGIIENHDELKKQLIDAGYEFSSETDTEVIAHLIHHHLKDEKDLLKASHAAIKKLKGAYALGIINKTDPDRLIAVRQGSPLVIGIGIGEHFIASDSLALLPVTQQFIYLEEGDFADVRHDDLKLYDASLNAVDRKQHRSKLSSDANSKDGYRHFMLKEIFEQPHALHETLEGRLSKTSVLEESFGIEAHGIFEKVQNIQIVACGTSYHAGLVARYWLESIAGVHCSVEIASEIRYRKAVVPENTLLVTISQSGETADTLAALRNAKQNKNYIASMVICNVPESSLVRESDLVFMTRAGVEVGVASTKAFTTQLLALLMFTVTIGQYHDLNPEKTAEMVKLMEALPRKVEEALELNKEIEALAKLFKNKTHTLFLGRGVEYPIAMEGALKLKEISYIHAEAYPAGELKHGPLALVDETMPVVTLMAENDLVDKVKSNLQEVQARGGQLITFVDQRVKLEADNGMKVISLPPTHPLLAPIVYTIPMQLLAYYVAVLKGTDVDQPRNLAKSVTVE